MKDNSIKPKSPRGNKTPTDDEIKRAVDSDPDTFIPDTKWFDKAQIVMPKNKDMVTLRLDHDIIEWFKHDGKGYQTRINAVLRSFIDAHTNKGF